MPSPEAQPERPEISVVIPCYNEEENVREIHAAVVGELSLHARSWEIIFIDNGSTDRTRLLMQEIATDHPTTRLIFNSRNFGQMRSPTYAIYQAEGDAVIAMGADFQDPPAMIGPLIGHWRAGADIVMGQRRTERASAGTRLARHIGYRLLGRMADYSVIPGATGFGLFSRRAVDTLAAWNEPEPFFRGMVVECGLPIALIPFDRPERAAGRTKNGVRELVDFAISSMAGSAKAMLRLPLFAAVYSGIAAAALLLLALILAVAGWGGAMLACLAAIQIGVLALLSFFLGLIGEQVRAIAERTRNVPLVIEDRRINFPEERQQPSPRTFVKSVPRR